MKITYTLNGQARTDEVDPVGPLTEYLRAQGCLSVKRGCETSNCGLCTVLVDGRPVLSCNTITARIDGKSVQTLEGLEAQAAEIGGYLADEGAEQCG
ncbi:MAG: 2Fe-2S iron-sulfur cluster-binding protein, partial [Eubacteriales bacterium]|nr:2Fe-2S iron-sulfur cluster-binding protein [Eubacteriales bacterium]